MSFLKLFLRGIPLALGLVLTLLSAVYAANAEGDSSNLVSALLLGLIGIPLLLASAVSISRAIEK